ncbi:PEP-CTERM sorting domain-containing protein [Cerasicoccus maritimus]|uniref:PEP-CTERM sorting domain-containing protein n=1 Tax=Cerasicoccus maritimus TaxID=490089 RepID=UPI002852A9FC|nr:PEP-CTERM sorting domain-containing protein [Cerasicoccus maritimus]
MNIPTTTLLAASCLAATSAQAILVGYWDMDASTVNGKLAPNDGDQMGTLSGSLHDLSVGFIDEVSSIEGTAVNAVLPVGDPNNALEFYHAGTVYASGSFRMSGFDFSELSDVTISFAYNSLNTFTWDTNLDVDYRINGGSWVDFAELETFQPDWSLASIALPSAVDGQSNVDIRIRTTDWLSISSTLGIDNVQVSAVPEPSTYALLLAAATLGLVAYRRRR